MNRTLDGNEKNYRNQKMESTKDRKRNTEEIETNSKLERERERERGTMMNRTLDRNEKNDRKKQNIKENKDGNK